MPRIEEPVKLHKVIPRIEAPVTSGLTSYQARERFNNGYANEKAYSAERTMGQILRSNIFTYLNLVLVTLALITMIFGTFWNITFLGIIIINTIIGIVQEWRSKQALSKLQFVTAPNATVVRDGQPVTIPTDHAVLDDIAIFTGDKQVYADAVVLAGECSVNESLITGESDEIIKKPGDMLLSGSFVVSGECIARLDKVGRDSFVSQLTLEAKKTKHKISIGMVPTLQKFVRVIGIIIIPIGITMFIRQFTSIQAGLDEITAAIGTNRDAVRDATDATVGALVAMIPDGLYLLVSMALTVSVMRLARMRTLVQERGCVETLARVNVLCVDKTGTITESNMEVKEVALLCEERYNADAVNRILADYAGNMATENATMAAIQQFIGASPRRLAMRAVPFSSAKKYSSITFSDSESYILGAPERIIQTRYYKYQSIIEAHSARGFRVVLLAHYSKPLDGAIDAGSVMPIALILLSNKIRKEAPETFSFFEKQGVKIIVISGDNPMTVSQIAREAGIAGAERYIDAAELDTDRKIKAAIKNYVVFGRVTPDQKRRLVRALKSAGFTVGMTGDGVNDVLALKDANCSIAMASGSEVASQVADIVLLDSNFAAMPKVVMEGRRVINNIERSASLFFSKNIFSLLFVLAVTIPTGRLFPLQALQFSLFNALLIAVPSFVLAMEPNKSLVRGRFLTNVFRNALPTGLTGFLALMAVSFFSSRFDVPADNVNALSLIAISFVGFLMLYRLCLPLNQIRIALIAAMFVSFIIGFILFMRMGVFAPITSGIWQLIVICILAIPVYFSLVLLFNNMGRRKNRRYYSGN